MPDYVIRGVLSGLTPAEKLYILTHPHHVPAIIEARDKASTAARLFFPGSGQHNGQGDAFRHAYASALLARDIGPENALRFTSAHEAYSANPPRERAMDLHNNAVGVAIGRFATERTTDASLATQVRMALSAERLLTSPPATGNPY